MYLVLSNPFDKKNMVYNVPFEAEGGKHNVSLQAAYPNSAQASILQFISLQLWGLWSHHT